VRVSATLRHMDAKARRGKRWRLQHPAGGPGEPSVQQHDRGALASHFVPGGQARNRDVASREALDGGNWLDHRTGAPVVLLPRRETNRVE
jgi:hypothetical protein